MATSIASALMASVTSRSVNPSRRSVMFRRRPQALEGVGLDARPVLPRHLHLQVAKADLGLEVQLLLAETFLLPRVSHEDADAVTFAALPLLAVIADLGLEEQRVHRPPRCQHGAALARRSILEPQAAAEELQAGDRPHAHDRERDGDLEEREPVGRWTSHRYPGYGVASRTATVPTRGSRCTRMRFWPPWARSRRLASSTSTPVVEPFG